MGDRTTWAPAVDLVSGPLVESALDRGVMTITLCDEERRNALGAELIGELQRACDAAESDPAVRVVVLTNRGRVFCAGANLAPPGPEDAPGPTVEALDPARLFGRFRASRKPYVGRIAGHCVGGGMGLAAAMDIAIAADDAKFGFTEVRIGVAPAVVSVVCLPKLRPVDARDVLLRGRRFPAEDAARMGLIRAAVARDRLDAEVAAVVDDLLLGGPEAIAATKEILWRVPAMDEAAAFDWARALSAELFAGTEAAEGFRAFLDKRVPSWAPDTEPPE
jgi:methylglutaconyl-CoA hydratase